MFASTFLPYAQRTGLQAISDHIQFEETQFTSLSGKNKYYNKSPTLILCRVWLWLCAPANYDTQCVMLQAP